MTEQTAANTDREIWRETPGDYYSPSIHVTEGGGIGINVGGTVIVRPVRDWHDTSWYEREFDATPVTEEFAKSVAVQRVDQGDRVVYWISPSDDLPQLRIAARCSDGSAMGHHCTYTEPDCESINQQSANSGRRAACSEFK